MSNPRTNAVLEALIASNEPASINALAHLAASLEEELSAASSYAMARLDLLREVMASELPRDDQLDQGFGRLLRDELIERIRDHLRDTKNPTPRAIVQAEPSGASARRDLRPPPDLATEDSGPEGLDRPSSPTGRDTGLKPPSSAGSTPASGTTFTTMSAGEDGWTEWTHPLPGYLMKCCDCGLVHELETRIVRDKTYLEDGSWNAATVTDPALEVIFRMRRGPALELTERKQLSAIELFALDVIEQHRNDGAPGDVDGGWMHDALERHGL